MDSDNYAERAKAFTSDMIGLQEILRGANLAAGIPGLIIFDFPYCGLTEVSREDNSGNIDLVFNWEAYNPKGSYNYNDPVRVYFLSTDADAYVPEE
jgi:hypothetical protein